MLTMETLARISSNPLRVQQIGGNGTPMQLRTFPTRRSALLFNLAQSSLSRDLHICKSSTGPSFFYDKSTHEEIIEKTVGLSLKRIEKVGSLPCGCCEAKGAILCGTCSGSGLYVDSILESQGVIVKVRCLSCGGSGNIMCSSCGGRGHTAII